LALFVGRDETGLASEKGKRYYGRICDGGVVGGRVWDFVVAAAWGWKVLLRVKTIDIYSMQSVS
tara:strand:- start:8096 stop:8287 length:192 start_codon:yes stop_codon:yes gene_type:complete